MLIFLIIIILATPSYPGKGNLGKIKLVVKRGVECGPGFHLLHLIALRGWG